MPRATRFTDECEARAAGLITATFTKIRVRLFKSATVVQDSTTVISLTEADYSGYSYVDLDPIAFVETTDGYALISGNKALSGVYLATFPGNSGADQTVYGIWVSGWDGVSEYALFLSNCFDVNPEQTLAGRTISGPSDSVLIAFRMYCWDYFKNRSQDIRRLGPQFLASSIYFPSPGGAVGMSFYMLTGENLVDESYNGTCNFSSTDPAGVSPSSVVFSGGQGNLTVSTSVSGLQTVTGVDVFDDTIRGTFSFIVGP